MDSRNERPEETRERLRQEERKNNPFGAFGDGINRAEHGSLTDLTGGLGWKGTGVILSVLVIGYVIYNIWF